MPNTSLPTASTIADWFLWRVRQGDRPRRLSNLKLQKLVYYSQAWYLAITGKPLFDDPIEAWVHGPVVRSLYFDYRAYGFGPITLDVEIENIRLSGDITEHLEDVWDVYGRYDGRYLEQLTHSEPPWQIAREGLDSRDVGTQEVSHDSMRLYYSDLLIEAEGDGQQENP